jgi:hypothetical protein
VLYYIYRIGEVMGVNRTEELVANKELMKSMMELVMEGYKPEELYYVALQATDKLRELEE